mgnify:CR=1 FL=1
MGLITKAALGALTGGMGGGGWAGAGKGAMRGAAGMPMAPQGPGGPGADRNSNAMLFHILNGLAGDEDALKALIEAAQGGKKRFDPNRPMDDNPRF